MNIKDLRFILAVVVFLLMAASIFEYSTYKNEQSPYPPPGLVLIGGLLFFGAISIVYKDPKLKILSLVLLILLSFTNMYFNGIKFGIDFVGGTRIPILLEHPVDSESMTVLIDIIKKRSNVLGFTETRVRAVGNSQINVEIPGNDAKTIDSVEQSISHQGVFQAVIDGKLAFNGERIYSSSIGPVNINVLNQDNADWGVVFKVDSEGAENFAKVAKGKTLYPVYLYLDRPDDAIVVFEKEQFKSFVSANSNEKEVLRAFKDALTLENKTIDVYISDQIENITTKTNKTKAIIATGSSPNLTATLKEKGFEVVEVSQEEMKPEFQTSSSGLISIGKFEAVGLLSAPFLGGETTNGVAINSFQISGRINSDDPRVKAKEGIDTEKNLESILKGGSLPVQISIGSRTSLPSELGGEFLRLSIIGIAISLVVISILVGLRYRNIKATIPIVIISLAEFVILVSILGSFSIDLVAMAGIIAAIGVGVDAQIVITDEILKKEKAGDHHTQAEKINLAFGIIRTNAIVAICSMLPLLFSSIVEIIGFALSTILGALLGYLLTRPAYATIIEMITGGEEVDETKSK